jgi:hypothetical protein
MPKCLPLAALLLLPGLAFAQQAPGRVGPFFPPREQEPQPAEVLKREQQMGLGNEFTPQQDRTVDQIFKDLTGSNPNQTQPAPTPSAGGSPRPQR